MSGWGLLTCDSFSEIIRLGTDASLRVRLAPANRSRSLLNVYYLVPPDDGRRPTNFERSLEMISRVINPEEFLLYPLTAQEFRSGAWQTSAKLLLLFDNCRIQNCNSDRNQNPVMCFEQYGPDYSQLGDYLNRGGRVMLYLTKPEYSAALEPTWSHMVWTPSIDVQFPLEPMWRWESRRFEAQDSPSIGSRMLLGWLGNKISEFVNLAVLPMSEELPESVLRDALKLLGIACHNDLSNGMSEQPMNGSNNVLYTFINYDLPQTSLDSLQKLITIQYSHCYGPKKTPIVVDALSNLPSGFSWSDYLSYRKTRYLGQCLFWAECMDSSWDYCSSFFSLLPAESGLLVVSNRQSKGKGRGANRWITPMGQAAFTFHLTLPNTDRGNQLCGGTRLMQMIVCIQHLIALSVVLTFKWLLAERLGIVADDACLQNEEFLLNLWHPGPQVMIKWPNDVLAVDATNLAIDKSTSILGKLAGILTRGSICFNKASILAGVGLNVRNRLPTVCLEDILNQIEPSPETLSTAKVIAIMMNRLEHLIDRTLNVDGLQWALNLYTQSWVHTNQSVQIRLPSGTIRQDCLIIGVDDFGYLRAWDPSTKEELTLHPDGNTMDMTQGLIVPK